jgi:hypothetical protein
VLRVSSAMKLHNSYVRLIRTRIAIDCREYRVAVATRLRRKGRPKSLGVSLAATGPRLIFFFRKIPGHQNQHIYGESGQPIVPACSAGGGCDGSCETY